MDSNKKTILTGIRPTGNLHLGHYFGAVKNWVNLQYDYNTFKISVNNNICKLYKDATLLKTIDGSTISDFVSWYDKLNAGILGGGANGHITQLAIYNKALSDVQIVDMIDYLKSLEVTA